MKKFLGLFSAFALFTVCVFGADLVFKTTKEVDSTELIEVGTFDATKYKQLRFKISNTHEKINSSEDYRNFTVSIISVESEKEVNLAYQDSYITFSTLMDTPPPKIRIKIKGKGKFEVYVWGTQ